MLATGAGGWALGQGAWTVGLLLGENGLPAVVQAVSYGLLPALGVPALCLLVRREASRDRTRPTVVLVLDAVLLVAAVVALGAALPLGEALADLPATGQLLLGSGDVAAGTVVLALLVLRASVMTGRLQVVGLGLLGVIGTDLVIIGLRDGGYVEGGALDVSYLAGLLLVAIGASLVDGRPPSAGRRVRRALLLLPYLPVSLALAKSGYDLTTTEASGELQVQMAMLLVVLAFARQAFTLLENDDLLQVLAAREAVMRQQALEDPLTGLANRTLLLERLQAALRDRAAGTEVCVLYVDLDDFKLINDTHGHDAGDQVLTEVAGRMAGLCGPDDTVARLGGDEFALLLVGHADPDGVADAVLAALSTPVVVGSRRFTVTASVGLVAVESAGETARTLLSHADIAMYTAKHGGKGRVAVVRGGDRAQAARKVRVRELIAHPQLEDFAVVYQPVVDLQSGVVRGVEALLRWHSPEVGDVPPDEFIHLAEQAGSISILGRHVLATTLADLARWQERYPQHRLAAGVNVSPVQLTDAGLLPDAVAGLRRHGLVRRPAGPRDHRAGARRRHRRRGRRRARDAHRRAVGRDRRLRHRLLLAALPRPLRGRRPEDRPLLRGEADRRGPQHGAGPLGHRPGPDARPADHRRGRRDPGAAAPAAGDGLRPGPGLALQPGRRRAAVRPAPGRRGPLPAARAAARAAPGRGVPGLSVRRSRPDSPPRHARPPTRRPAAAA